jgi:hypothetical protein
MAWLDPIKTFINNLDEKQFYLYLGGLLGVVFLSVLLIVMLFYKKVNYYKKQIALVNEQRQEIQALLQKNFRVEQQQAKIKQLLAENENFKIGGFFDDLLKKLQLTNKKLTSRVFPLEASNEYREIALEANFADMTMQQLCVLLNEMRANKLVYPKDLTITKSKTPRTIDVTLVIATLQPKSESTETAE